MDEQKKYTILSASGMPVIDSDLQRFNDIDLVGTCRLKSDIEIILQQMQILPECVVISDMLNGDEELIELILKIHREYPAMRVIYLAGTLDTKDLARTDQLGMLVINGIYDIVVGKVTPTLIRDIIAYPKAEESVAYLKTHLLSKKAEIQNAAAGFEYEGFGTQEKALEHKNNMFLVWSSKPGSGKSFISANLAAAVARYGLDRPKVALIDGDMQNLSIGNILGIKPDPERNLKIAMQSVQDLLDGKCDTEERIRRAEKKVRSCFVRYKGLTNLDVLAGSGLSPREAYGLNLEGRHYQKLISIIENLYDYIIVDLNSSIFSPSTYTLMEMCKEVYCVINLDYNNILNSARYKDSLKAFNIDDKIHYVLNQDFTNDGSGAFGTDKEELNMTGDNIEEKIVHLDARIPNIEPSIFFNRQLDGKPIILYKKQYTEKVRLAILKLAERICPIDPSIINDLQRSVNNQRKGFFSSFFKKKQIEEQVPENTDENSELDYNISPVTVDDVTKAIQSCNSNNDAQSD